MHERSESADRVERVLRERIAPAVHDVVGELTVAAWHVEGGQGEPVPPVAALAADYEPFAVGDAWGPAWGTTWFHLTGEVPEAARNERVELIVDLGWTAPGPGFQAEGLAYRPDGSVLKGLHPRNEWLPVTDAAVDVYIEAAANPLVLSGFGPTPLGEKSTAGDRPLYRLERADIAVLRGEVWELMHDVEVLDQLARELHLDDPRAWQLRAALDRCLDALDLDDVAGTAAQARAELAEVLARPAVPSAHRITAVGHAHIDSAWLWPVRETVRKIARTASNVVALLDENPELVYAMSSAQQFEWLEEHRPEVFALVAKHVQAGRFVPVGGMWVESDTNLPGSEAMARQFVYGTRYFEQRFGVRTREVWLPDSFGYSAALPQLIRLSGARWFLTQKISWNRTNPFPHHTFWWEGIDGTRVFTHFPPVDTYTAQLSGRELAHAVRNFREKAGSGRSLVPFGFGDGGGGPTRDMLARAARTADLEGSPKVTLDSPAAFFEAAQREYPDAPVWVGELYLELHRGTYTSQALMKQGNRRSEHLLREAELWCTSAAVAGVLDYPYDTFERLWKVVLLNQFHDILPGSSISWVHREARAAYAATCDELRALVSTAQQALCGDGDTEIAFNAAPVPVAGIAALSSGLATDAAAPVDVGERDGSWTLENGVLRVRIDAHGVLSSVHDLVADREVLAGRGNVLQLHPDLPNKWDAWDVDAFYRNRVTDILAVESLELLPRSGGAATVRVVRTFGASRVVQDVTLAPGSRQVDLRTEVDWHEREKFLKAAFDVDVHTDRAAYEIQYGHVYRPTHENTTWEAARFEVCAHRFVHVGEAGYGVAVVNDSTYGHDLRRQRNESGATSTTVRLSLLRAPRFPDPETDQGTHVFGYALVAGADLRAAIAAGYAINLPLRVVRGAAPPAAVLTVQGDPGVLVEAVKLADDHSGDVVVRLYESLGGRATAHLHAGFDVRGWIETDLLEDAVPPDATRGCEPGEVRLRPFQVVTLRLRR